MNIIDYLKHLRQGLQTIYYSYIKNVLIKGFGEIHKTTDIGLPFRVTRKRNVFLAEKTRIQAGMNIITYTGKIIVKKYTAISYNCTIVTGNHIPTVGISQYLIGKIHKNDKERDVVIEEDVWVGTNVTILSKAHLGRGCIIGANSLVNKEIPPYAIAVGNPIKIIGTKFTIEQILKHEEVLYPVEERLSIEFLNKLFNEKYQGLKAIGINNDE